MVLSQIIFITTINDYYVRYTLIVHFNVLVFVTIADRSFR
jgi:hypothetical protein